MSEVGKRLQEERQRRRITLNDIAHVTKIPLKYLQALEEGTIEALPSSAHALAFLHKYCSILDLPSKQLVALFKSEFYPTITKEAKKTSFVKPPQKLSFVITTRQLIAFAVLVFCFFLIFSIFSQLKVLLEPPFLVVIAPQEGELIENTNVEIEGRTAPDAILKINERTVEVAADGYFKEKLELPPEVKNQTIILSSTNKTSSATTRIRRNIRVQAEIAQPIDTTVPAITVQAIRLSIRVTEDTWLKIEVDGNEEEIILPKGATKILTAQQKITVRSGKSHVTYISYNAGPEEQMGSRGPLTKVWVAPGQ